MLAKISLEFLNVENGLGHVDVDLDMFGRIIWVDELGLTNEGCRRVTLGSLHHRHACDVLDGALVRVEHRGEFGALPNNLIEDIDLVVDGDASVLAETLDTVGNLAAQTLTLELGSQFSFEHHSCGALGFAAPLGVGLDISAELLDNFEHSSGNFVAIDVNAPLT